MSTQEALNIVKEFQKDEIYLVPNNKTKTMLVKAMRQVFEENADVYIARIKIGDEPTMV